MAAERTARRGRFGLGPPLPDPLRGEVAETTAEVARRLKVIAHGAPVDSRELRACRELEDALYFAVVRFRTGRATVAAVVAANVALKSFLGRSLRVAGVQR